MPRVGLEPMNAVFVRAKTVNALDCEGTVIGLPHLYKYIMLRINPML
jgi:hypothetical protein